MRLEATAKVQEEEGEEEEVVDDIRKERGEKVRSMEAKRKRNFANQNRK